MREPMRWGKRGILFLAAGLALTACGSSGDLVVSNESHEDVTVTTGDRAFEKYTVTAGGGISILESGCSEADISVEFSSGLKVVVPGPVCPEDQILISDGRVEIRALEP